MKRSLHGVSVAHSLWLALLVVFVVAFRRSSFSTVRCSRQIQFIFKLPPAVNNRSRKWYDTNLKDM